jgi:lipopolysaccharide export system protein LptA
MALLICSVLQAAPAPAFAQRAAGSSPLLPGGDPHAPINVNADRLEYFSKEQKAIYSGHVLARQGAGTLAASVLTIFFVSADGPGGASAGATDATRSRVKRMEAAGPVTITKDNQVGVGDSAVYEQAQNTVVLSGNVSLTQGPDVVKGDKLIYDLNTDQAQVVGRVTSLFIPGQIGATPTKPVRPDHRKTRGAGPTEKRL